MVEIAKGVLTGFITAFVIGPVFFALIQTSIEKGVRSGILMALGISMSDMLYIALTYFGISQLSENAKFRIFMAMTGGVVMLIFGIRMFTRTVSHIKPGIHLHDPTSVFWKVSKGFVLNGINPFVLLYWIGVVSLVSVHWDYNGFNALIFFIALLTTILSTDIGKAYLAHRIRTSITPRLMNIINKVVGITFILLGARLLIFALHLGEEITASGQSLLQIIY